MCKRILCLSAALAIAHSAPLSARPVEGKCAARPDTRTVIQNAAGSVEVEVWDRSEVHVTGKLGQKATDLRVECGNGSEVRIEVEVPRQTSGLDGSFLQVRVPKRGALAVQTVSADVSVQRLQGEAEISSVSGDLNLVMEGPRVSARTVSGKVRLQASAVDATVNSVSGDIHARGLQGKLHGETVSGDLDLSGGPWRDLNIKTVSGDIRIAATLANKGEVEAETLSGRVELELPRDIDANIVLRTFSGVLRTDFEGGSRSERRVEQTVGKGGGRVELHSFSGDIRLRRE